ncbi:hypothetical protein [Azospirillum doebereinerae]
MISWNWLFANSKSSDTSNAWDGEDWRILNLAHPGPTPVAIRTG